MITVLLLNWRRPENLCKIVEALREQTLQPRIFLWNNSYRIRFKDDSPELDWVVNSSQNRGCMPRWWMAAFAETPYVMTLDDDLLPGPGLCEAVVSELEKVRDQDPFAIVGAFGKQLLAAETYYACPEAEPGKLCPLVLGRLMALPTDTVKNLRIPFTDPLGFSTDDICISGLCGGGHLRRHYISPRLREHLTELPAEHALCMLPGHFDRREEARRKWIGR